MGVPAFFRWLTKKYPSVIVHCIEDKVQEIDGVKVPVNAVEPNPNGVEFDNLYLDMNGIIHPCTHPEDRPAPKNEDEMMVAIFDCIDRIFRIVRPRKLLYMAIDGVAPRAKMNQQRSRRFRASKETYEKVMEIERIRDDLASKGCFLPPVKEKGAHFDSNCITPGTPFFARLTKALNYYIHERLNSDPAWRGIKVILSDASVPGEGEHKVMDFIRRQRAQADHDPNTSHCLCGADADLIMLGLATHEPNFTIIREEFRPNKPRPCEICGQEGHEMKDCLGLEKECPPDDGSAPPVFSGEAEYIFVRINVLREYLTKELDMPNLPFKFDIERAVDDWVFMCFFVGNDFLPHLPSLEIREGAIDRLVRLYKEAVYKTGGWLTDNGIPNLNRVQLIMSKLGEAEDEIFKNRQDRELQFKERNKAQKRRRTEGDVNCYSKPNWSPSGQFAPTAVGRGSPGAIYGARNEAFNMRVQGMHTNSDNRRVNSNTAAAAALKSLFKNKNNSSSTSDLQSSTSLSNVNPSLKRKSSTMLENNDDRDEDEVDNDEVRLYEPGFKDRYYESKFDVLPQNKGFRKEVGHQYVRGLCWVLQYYYQGCPSWEWYFPYHYAPFASDFIDIGTLSTQFEKNTKPFNPFEQLMSVFPAASRGHVPEPWGKLMIDPESPIIDFYPEDFQIDLNGKKFAWQGVALLPFVDEVRLKEVLASHYHELTPEEIQRNTCGSDRLYVRKGHDGYDFLQGLYENKFEFELQISLEAQYFQGMGGNVQLSTDVVPHKGTIVSPIPRQPDIYENEVITLRFQDLQFDANHIFLAKRLPNAKDPPTVLKPGDLSAEASRNWRPMIGMARSNVRASLDISGHRALGNYVPRGNHNSNNNYRGGGNNSNWGGGNNNNRGYGEKGAGWREDRSSSNQRHSYGSYNNNQQQSNSYETANFGRHSYGGSSSSGNNYNSRGGQRDYSGGRGGHSGGNNRGNYNNYNSNNSQSGQQGYFSSNYRGGNNQRY